MRLTFDLRSERFERGLSQERIAEDAGVAQSTWSRAERGKPIAPGEAQKIAEFLGRRVSEIWKFEVAA